MGRSIKGHPLQERLRAVPLKMAASFVSNCKVEDADKATRALIFREFGRLVIGKHKERRQHGFNSDPGGEIVRGLEQAFQAGISAASLKQARDPVRNTAPIVENQIDDGSVCTWVFDED